MTFLTLASKGCSGALSGFPFAPHFYPLSSAYRPPFLPIGFAFLSLVSPHSFFHFRSYSLRFFLPKLGTA
jgi:hypothetical protein